MWHEKMKLLIHICASKLEFARSNEPCVDFHKKARCELAHKRDLLWKDTYGECRDIEPQRSGGEMSAWRIASPLKLLHHDKREFVHHSFFKKS
jgi:hypothetical protein